MLRAICCLFTLPMACVASAQQPWSIGASGHYGYLWPHRPSSWILVEGHAGATEIFAERQVSGSRPWHRAYGLPRYGFLALHTRMANPQHIGDAVGLIPYLCMPLAHGERSSFGLRLGWGVGLIAKPFERRENTRQIAIGSRINTAIQIMPEYQYRLSRLAFRFGVGIDHWSNGSIRLPNLGLNFLSASMGIAYALSSPAPVALVDTTAYERPHREFCVVGAAGISESGRPLNGQCSVWSLNGDASWRMGRKGAWSAGLDLFNKGDLRTIDPDLDNGERLTLTQVGVHGGGALLMGRGELLFHFGAYVITPIADDAPVYQRIGGRYRIGRHLIASACLKTHFATADHWEFGIGYRWN